MNEHEIDTLRALLLAQAERLWSAHLIGNAPPAVKRQWREMRSPVLGDFVFVLHAAGAPHRRCIGVLRSIHRMTDDGSPIEFTMELLDGRFQHWENAQAVKLFASPYPEAPSIVPEASE